MSATSEGRRFDDLATSYADVINDRAMRLTGESFEYFLERRLCIMRDLLEREGRSDPATILDFGCGAGATERVMRELFPKSRLVGLDASAESVRVARALAIPESEFVISDGLRFPLEDASVDAVYSNGTFHHIAHRDHAAIAREMLRVLKPGGHAFIFENNGINPAIVWAMARAEIDRGARRVFCLKMRSTLRDAGFEVRGVRFYFFFPKLLDALRRREALLDRVPLGAQYLVWAEKRR